MTFLPEIDAEYSLEKYNAILLKEIIKDRKEHSIFGGLISLGGIELPLNICFQCVKAPELVEDILEVNKEIVPKGITAQDVITALKIACDVSDWYSQKACPHIRKL